MRVLKFGGSSLADPDRLRNVAVIVGEAAGNGPVAVVVSAMGGVTDDLIAAASAAAEGGDGFRAMVAAVADRHRETAAAVAADDELQAIGASLDTILRELSDLLHGASLVGECTARTSDAVLSCGERMSSLLVAATLRRSGLAAEACDARCLIVTDDDFGNARVDMEGTETRVREYFRDNRPLQVVTGFIGANSRGETTTLGRGGSDFTASVIGAALRRRAGGRVCRDLDRCGRRDER
jgi:aspartokinase/homoserine dehydrogenase 1